MRGLVLTACLCAFSIPLPLSGQVTAPAATQPATKPVSQADLNRLIDELGDSDFDIREAAAARLMEVGRPARKPLEEASQSDNPELAARARSLLRRLPWHTDTDPEAVKKALRDYTLDQPPENWVNALRVLYNLPNGAGADALLRILQGEVSPERRWVIATLVKGMPKTPAIVVRLREMEAEVTNAPALWVAGTTWLSHDVKKATTLLAKAADLEFENPTLSKQSGPAGLFTDLQRLYERTGRWEEAASLLRRRYDAQPSQTLVDALFALHADRGGLPGLVNDLAKFQRPVNAPVTWYTHARSVDRAGLSIASEPLRFLADVLSIPRPGENAQAVQARRYTLATFLLDRRWLSAAERELRGVLQLSTQANDTYAVNVHFRLANIAAARKDDAAVAAEYELALNGWQGTGGILTADSDGESVIGDDALRVMKSIMHRHGFRAAHAKKDTEEMVRRANELIALGQQGRHGGLTGGNPDLAIDAVTALREVGEKDLAAKLFKQAYEAHKSRLALNPDDPVRMNSFAWLCARCGEHLEEAETVITQALKLAPDNPAFIDTSAEVQYQLGRFEKAVQIQERAIKLAPDEPELQEQMKRFKAALKAAATKPATQKNSDDSQ